ncbi:lipI, partial [Symbiodinium pilosum]
YYDEMTTTFEDIKAKRDIVEKEITELLDEKEEIEKRMAKAQSELEAVEASNKSSTKAKRKNDRILRQLEAGGAIARQALRRLQLSRMPLAQRVANVRQDFREAALSNVTPSSPVSRQRVAVDDLQMTLRQTGEEEAEIRIALRRYTPPGLSEPPVIVFFHGESYVAGDLDTHGWMCESLAVLSRAAVVSVAYRQPPEVRFPGAFNDAFGSVCWVAEGGLGYSPPFLALAGDAAGGGLAAACALRAALDGPRIALQVLLYPWLDVRPTSQSMLSFEETNDLHLMMQEELAFASEVYGPKVDVPEDEDEEDDDDGPKVLDWMKAREASPLLAESLRQMPRTFLAYAADDLLAPDCRSFAARLRTEVGGEAVHELELPAPLGPGFAKDPQKPQAYAALAAAGAFVSALSAKVEKDPAEALPAALSWLFNWDQVSAHAAAERRFEVRLLEDEDVGRKFGPLPGSEEDKRHLNGALVLCSFASRRSGPPPRTRTCEGYADLATAELPGHPDLFQDFLANCKAPGHFAPPERGQRSSSPAAPATHKAETPSEHPGSVCCAVEAAETPTTAGGMTGSSSPELSPRQPLRALRELLEVVGIRKALLDSLPVVSTARCRGTSPAVRGMVAAYLHARAGRGASQEFDFEVEPAGGVAAPSAEPEPVEEPPMEEAKTEQSQQREPQAGQLAHISGMLRPPLLATPRGHFTSKVSVREEVERDLARLLADPNARIFVLSQPGCSLRPLLARGRSAGRTALEALSAGLPPLPSEQSAAHLAAQTAAAMSASIGVDFTVQAGLLPQFHQPMFVLLLLGPSPGADLQARLIMSGFVAGKAKHVQGDRPDSKFTPWCASLASPDLLKSSPEPGSIWSWDYSVREAFADDIGTAVECDVLQLADAVSSGK